MIPTDNDMIPTDHSFTGAFPAKLNETRFTFRVVFERAAASQLRVHLIQSFGVSTKSAKEYNFIQN